MPTYEYECEKCKKGFDLFQSMKDDPVRTCPKEKCQMKRWGKGKVRRLMGTGAGLIFKGSGFYITDYRSEGYKTSASKESGSGETKSAAADTAGSKPATPASVKPTVAEKSKQTKAKE